MWVCSIIEGLIFNQSTGNLEGRILRHPEFAAKFLVPIGPLKGGIGEIEGENYYPQTPNTSMNTSDKSYIILKIFLH